MEEISTSTHLPLSTRLYRIDLGSSEYLLIENRQPISFDAKLPAGGLAIWHIDEAATNLVPGFPNQDGWPKNGKHYKVALLQADGKYDLEQAINSGDSGDLFYASGQSRLGPSFMGGKYPNTDAYQGGLIKQSGVTIEKHQCFLESHEIQCVLLRTSHCRPSHHLRRLLEHSPLATKNSWPVSKQEPEELETCSTLCLRRTSF